MTDEDFDEIVEKFKEHCEETKEWLKKHERGEGTESI